jgi:predicted DNA-binding transcriptional regulator
MNVPFTQVANHVLQNPNLSAKAKGLYAYLFSKPQGWDFAVSRIAKEFSDGERSIRSGLQELESHNLLKRKKTPTGQVDYILTFIEKKPSLQNDLLANEPSLQNVKQLKRQNAETQGLSNKEENKVIKRDSNKELATTSVAGDIQKVIERFQTTVNPLIDYGNKTERKAAEEMIKAWGVEKVLALIDYCNEIRTEEFAPNVTTPHELKRKYPKVIHYKQKNEPVKVPEIQTCPTCFVTPCVCR